MRHVDQLLCGSRLFEKSNKKRNIVQMFAERKGLLFFKISKQLINNAKFMTPHRRPHSIDLLCDG